MTSFTFLAVQDMSWYLKILDNLKSLRVSIFSHHFHANSCNVCLYIENNYWCCTLAIYINQQYRPRLYLTCYILLRVNKQDLASKKNILNILLHIHHYFLLIPYSLSLSVSTVSQTFSLYLFPFFVLLFFVVSWT